MRIGLDARAITKYFGIGRYSQSLIKQLAVMDKENEYFVFQNGNCPDFYSFNPRFHRVVVDIPPFSPATLWGMNRLFKDMKLDLFHSLFNVTPAVYHFKSVVTVHDLMDITFPRHFSNHSTHKAIAARFFHRIVGRMGIKRASKIITNSQYIKEHILSFFKIPEDKIKVIHMAAAENYNRTIDFKSLNRTKQRLGLPDRFILYLGDTKLNKNLERLLKAFKMLLDTKPMDNIKLVIAGKKHRFGNQLIALSKSLGINGQTVFLGVIHEDDIPALYTAAEVFVLPSLYEGFGLAGAVTRLSEHASRD